MSDVHADNEQLRMENARLRKQLLERDLLLDDVVALAADSASVDAKLMAELVRTGRAKFST